MHWTLIAMALAVAWAACAAPWRKGSLALALSWCLAQAWWLWTGDQIPIGLYRVLDLAVVAVILSGPVGLLDWLILTIFAGQWLAYDNLSEPWWPLFWMAFAQMVLAGPWSRAQRILFSVSHGPFRAGGAA